MNNEPIEGMVPTADGRYAVMVDTKNGHYGWVFTKHPDGMWVSSRKATAAERSAAEHHYNSEAAFRKMFAGVPKSLTELAMSHGITFDQLSGRFQPAPTDFILAGRKTFTEDEVELATTGSIKLRPYAEPYVQEVPRQEQTASEKDREQAAEQLFNRLCPGSKWWKMDDELKDRYRAEVSQPPVSDEGAMLTDHNRLVRELDVLLNGEVGAADQASLCDIVAQVRMARKKPGTGALQLLALVPDQVVGRVHHNPDQHDQVRAVLNECGRALPDHAPLYARPADTILRYVRAPSRKDPKYHEEWPEIEGGPVFDGVTYCNDLFAALKRYNVIVAETMPEGAVDE